VPHFKILYRQFLFRLMDVEFLAASARGDASQLLGQFASMLVFVSLASCYAALIFGDHHESAIEIHVAERLLIEITMLVVGIFALLSWDSTFPDKRDIQILVPLPVRGRELFIAKIAAAASALGLTVLALNGLSGLVWPASLYHAASGAGNLLRFFAAFWITLPAAGLFLYCAMLGVQGIVAQLPRGWFLRISSFLQVGAFALFLGVIFSQPSFPTTQALSAPENQTALAWLPPYWFMGLFNRLSGAYPDPAMAALAERALTNLAIAVLIAAGAFVLSWLRTLRKIAEEPDILPGSRGGVWLPPFGNRPRTALVHFTIRTLGRSRQHRMNLAFYLGLGFAMVAVSMEAALDAAHRTGVDVLRQPMNTPLLVSSLLMLCVCILGTRVAFSRPLDLRANWLFQITPVQGGAPCLSATRRALLTLSVIPVWLGSAAALLWYWPWTVAAQHLLLSGLFGVLLVEGSLIGFRKIPFSCSYLPGKSKVHLVFAASILMLPMVLMNCVEIEQWIASDRRIFWTAALILFGAPFAVRRIFQPEDEIQFEEFANDELISLGL
jgi:hypothetical protein